MKLLNPAREKPGRRFVAERLDGRPPLVWRERLIHIGKRLGCHAVDDRSDDAAGAVLYDESRGGRRLSRVGEERARRGRRAARSDDAAGAVLYGERRGVRRPSRVREERAWRARPADRLEGGPVELVVGTD